MNNASKIHPDQKRAGWLAKGANAMFHFSGLIAVTNAMRTGYANMSANIMANKLSIKLLQEKSEQIDIDLNDISQFKKILSS